ncbi:hypothetical protein BDR26DRAFT_1009010 [Obelidium mucronatum]|nr:hypothetical protein BDR26DRAFT_1009010 [Obelidium mucronatum]
MSKGWTYWPTEKLHKTVMEGKRKIRWTSVTEVVKKDYEKRKAAGLLKSKTGSGNFGLYLGILAGVAAGAAYYLKNSPKKCDFPCDLASSIEQKTIPEMVAVPRSQSTTPVVSRKEVRVFFQDTKQGSLFVQAFAVLQARDPKDPKSFAQVSSIHGLPNTEYDGFPSDKPDGGYCVHGQSLFPTWHRPYIALLEMLIVEAAKEIAKKYTVDTQTWLAAAAAIRFPYWDFADDATIKSGIPSALVDETIMILAAPDAKPTSVRNPMASFIMPSYIRDQFPANMGPLKTYKQTVRFPTSTAPDAKSDNAKLQRAIMTLAPQLRSMVRVLFDGTVVKWQDFSNHALDFAHKNAGNYHSLEYIHDQVHGAISGNGGHMGYADVAAYDPIFYFHHCNVDRLLALYESTFDLFMDDAKLNVKGLAPFKMDSAGKVWTTQESRETNSMGYSYPEMNLSGKALQQALLTKYGRPGQVVAAPAPAAPVKVAAAPAPALTGKVTGTRSISVEEPVVAATAPAPAENNPVAALTNQLSDGIQSLTKGFSNLFGGAAPQPAIGNSTSRGINAAAAAEPHAAPVHHAPSSQAPIPGPSAGNNVPKPHFSAYAHFSVKKNAINGPLTIKFLVNGKYAGRGYVFARIARDQCANCVDLDDLTIGGAVSLTDAFTAEGLLDHQDRWASAVKYEMFDWEGNRLPSERVPSLKVNLRTAVERPADSGRGNGTLACRKWGSVLVDV